MLAVAAWVVFAQTGCETGEPAVSQSEFTATGLRKGYMALDVEGSDLEGTPMRLSDFRGKVVVLEFWSST